MLMKNIFRLLFAGLLFVNCLAAVKAQSAGNDGAVFSDSGSIMFQNDEYMIVVGIVNDLNKTLEIWSVPDSKGAPVITTTTRVRIDEPISPFLAYAVRKPKIDMTYSIRLLRPDGTFSVNTPVKALEIGRGDVSSELMYCANEMMTTIFEETDEYGKYQYHITVYDYKVPVAYLIMEFSLTE
jgi:hypothetical protein